MQTVLSHSNEVDAFIKNKLECRVSDINSWIENESKNIDPPIYSSFDTRNSGFKVAPIDANLFPGGFNNLSQKSVEKAAIELKFFVEKYYPKIKKIQVIPESFTKNLRYLENLISIQQISRKAGYEIEFVIFSSSDEVKFRGFPELRFKPFSSLGDEDLMIMNNDFTEGVPEEIKELYQSNKNIMPDVSHSWEMRTKDKHFEAYQLVSHKFAADFDIDPWLISAYTKKCSEIGFKEKKGLECVAKNIDKIIHKIQVKFDEYSIRESPFVFVKPNRGTFGMGIMTVSSGDELLEINKKKRHSMNKIKNGILNTEVLIQEGITTNKIIEGYPAESTVYMIGDQPVGSIHRYNPEKSNRSNLNSRGMLFKKFDNEDNRLENIVARLSLLAVSKEGDF